MAKRVTLSSVVCLKHKVCGSVSREKIGGIDSVDKPGHERLYILCTEVWMSSLLKFIFTKSKYHKK